VSRCRTGSMYVELRCSELSDAAPLLAGKAYEGGVGDGVLPSKRCLGGLKASGGAGGSGDPAFIRDGSPPRVEGACR
jgi:hypothetical protein